MDVRMSAQVNLAKGEVVRGTKLEVLSSKSVEAIGNLDWGHVRGGEGDDLVVSSNTVFSLFQKLSICLKFGQNFGLTAVQEVKGKKIGLWSISGYVLHELTKAPLVFATKTFEDHVSVEQIAGGSGRRCEDVAKILVDQALYGAEEHCAVVE